MFRLDTGQARTDLYGIDKGEAQVIDTSSTERSALLAQREKAAADKAKQKAEQDRMDGISTEIGAMASVPYMARDRQLIADKTQAVKDYTLQNIDKLRKGDPASTIQFQNLYGDLRTTAEQSKDAREVWEARGATLAANPNKYRPDAMKYHLDFASKDHIGDFAYDDSKLKENYDYGSHVLTNLLPAAQKMETQNGYSTDFTLPQAKDLISKDLTDHTKYEQVAYDFNNTSPQELAKLGDPKTPVEYAQAKYANNLVVRDRKPIPMSERKTDEDKLPKVAGTYTNEGSGKGEFQFEYTNTSDNPYLTIQDPKSKPNNTIIADKRKKAFAEDSQFLDDNPKAKENKQIYDNNLKDQGYTQSEIDGSKNDGSAIEVKPLKIVYDGKNTHMIGLTKPGKDENGIDVPGKEVQIPFNQASDIMANKFGIKNIYDIPGGNAPKHVTVKNYDVSKSEEPVKEEKRKTKDGKIAVFNSATKQFIRFE